MRRKRVKNGHDDSIDKIEFVNCYFVSKTVNHEKNK